MTATDILNSWRRVANAFSGHSTAWLKLLAVAEAGNEGATVEQILGHGSGGGWRSRHLGFFVRMERQGIVTIDRSNKLGGQHSYVLRITPKGLRALGLENAQADL